MAAPSSGFYCSATIVGERVLLTAAHCLQSNKSATFKLNQIDYQVDLTTSPLYPNSDHDLAIGLIDQPVAGIRPASLGKAPALGLRIALLGYGCTAARAIDHGVLRKGLSIIRNFEYYEFVSSAVNGGAICFGDTGGPSFLEDWTNHYIVGVHSKGNLKDTNYDVRLDSPESLDFIQDWASQNQVEICGLHLDCLPPPDDSSN